MARSLVSFSGSISLTAVDTEVALSMEKNAFIL